MSFVLNKKVLILFNTMDKMNKISTFVPHLSVIQHLSTHFTFTFALGNKFKRIG